MKWHCSGFLLVHLFLPTNYHCTVAAPSLSLLPGVFLSPNHTAHHPVFGLQVLGFVSDVALSWLRSKKFMLKGLFVFYFLKEFCVQNKLKFWPLTLTYFKKTCRKFRWQNFCLFAAGLWSDRHWSTTNYAWTVPKGGIHGRWVNIRLLLFYVIHLLLTCIFRKLNVKYFSIPLSFIFSPIFAYRIPIFHLSLHQYLLTVYQYFIYLYTNICLPYNNISFIFTPIFAYCIPIFHLSLHQYLLTVYQIFHLSLHQYLLTVYQIFNLSLHQYLLTV